MKQQAFTVIAPVIPHKLDELRTILTSINNDVEQNPVIPFSRLSTIHFARFVIIESQKDLYPVQLAFSSNHDGDEEDHISELIQVAENGFKKIYNCCKGFDGDIYTYFMRHKILPKAFYIGHRGRGLMQIRNESRLQKSICDFLDTKNNINGLKHSNAAEIKSEVEDHIKSNPDLAFAWKEKVPNGLTLFLKQRALFILLLALILGIVTLILKEIICPEFPALQTTVVSLLAVCIFIFFMLKGKLNRLEKNDKIEKPMASSAQVNSLLMSENFVVQNQLTHIVEVKAGSFRRHTLKLVLWGVNLLAAIRYNSGNLGGIPSIHFARWVMIDNDRRLLFFSNFDGSWENYLGDFVDKAAIGLTAVWSNAKNFPKTKNLIDEGAKDEQHFKEWARQHQIQTQVWYTAYKNLSVENINNNSAIRRDLFKKMSEANSKKWLYSIYNAYHFFSN